MNDTNDIYEELSELVSFSEVLTRLTALEDFRAIKGIKHTRVKGNILFQLIYEVTSSYEEFTAIFNDWKKLDEQHSLEEMYKLFTSEEGEEENV